ncbi:ferritin-like domain-containing protein [Myxococcus stipitatus]|uniref:ferritin-like domain-containing protein n=1 Tax=Myxococcus stipitatus TaxID=83455 RepID=UPI0006939AC4|nr:ferritin-like domain-containing protein [Myxococcus stipitatus]
MLSLCACGPSEDCSTGPLTLTAQGIELASNDPAKQCNQCPRHPEKAPLHTCTVRPLPDTTRVDLVCHYLTCSNDGRRPEGLQDVRPEESCELGMLFAHAAWLEAASVPAFLRLADELRAHGAPERLIQAARRSAADEVRHTRVMRELAHRHGATMPEVDLAPFQSRDLEAMCLENATEGCVREAYGALVAGWQARTANDEEVRQAMTAIARDELRHAELAWAVDDWATERLPPEARARLREAREEALLHLRNEVERHAPPPLLVRDAGVPSRDEALRLVNGMTELLA